MVGTCLSLSELRRLCPKLGLRVPGSATDYELHRSYVCIAAEHSRAAGRLGKYLDRKYRLTIRLFGRLDSDAELEKHWRAAVLSGELAPAYWALVTHPGASVELLDRVYGEVHMLSHLAGAAVRVDKQELTRLRHLSATLTKQLAASEKKAMIQSTKRERALVRLQKDLRQAHTRLQGDQRMRERLRALEDDPRRCRLQAQLEHYAEHLATEQRQTAQAQAGLQQWQRMAVKQGDRVLRLEGRLAELQVERDALELALEKLLAADCSGCGEQEGCANSLNLCGRCILYVGGRARQCARFRALVERQNGRFIHHDGGLHDGRLRLGSILPQADAVLCPLDCVSHDATNRVRQFCKRHGKQLVLLPRSSLAAFTRGLSEVAA